MCEYYDDIDNERVQINLPKSVYAGRGLNECVHIFKSNPTTRLGTGFLINNDGIIISAAHTVNNIKQDLFTVHDSKKYAITILLDEYCDPEECPYTHCMDLLIGKLIDFKAPKDFSPGILTSNEIDVSDLQLEGYCPHIDNEYYATIEYEGSQSYYNQLRNNVMMPLSESEKDCRCTMINTAPFYLENPNRFSGMSGGPVYRNKEIYGVFLGNVYIKSSYILSKLKELRIKI